MFESCRAHTQSEPAEPARSLHGGDHVSPVGLLLRRHALSAGTVCGSKPRAAARRRSHAPAAHSIAAYTATQ